MSAAAAAVEVARAAKAAGQQLSIEDMHEVEVDAFLDVVRAVRPGVEFTVNDLRPALDGIGIPVKSRGGLFSAAVKAGLCRPAVVVVDGRAYPKTVPSTGRSANAAHVRVYVRTGEGGGSP